MENGSSRYWSVPRKWTFRSVQRSFNRIKLIGVNRRFGVKQIIRFRDINTNTLPSMASYNSKCYAKKFVNGIQKAVRQFLTFARNGNKKTLKKKTKKNSVTVICWLQQVKIFHTLSFFLKKKSLFVGFKH